MVLRSDDTIAAIATAPGDGAIAVVRVSGPAALTIADRLFRGNAALAGAAGFTAHLGRIIHPTGTLLDQAVVTVYRAPHSYTGEDSVEISCHGGGYLTARVLEALLAAGARAAAPGEFTRRAFMNGKLDLTQAEAIADLIASRSERARRISMEQLQGRLGEKVRMLRDDLIKLCSLLELELDFTEEGIQLATNEEIIKRIEIASRSIGDLIRSYETGKLLRDGISVAIVGPPNVGKSSLFNSLLEHDRAIVTHIAGTTRDTLEESALLDGVVFRLTDTAGIRESSDIVESIGIDRTRITITASDVVLLVCDDEAPVGNRVSALLDPTYTGKTVIVRNKSDLLPHVPADLLDREPPEIHVSAKTGYGVDVLRSILSSLAGVSGSAGEGGQLITRERHRAALQITLDRLMAARQTVLEGTSTEFVALDIRGATEALGEITGEVTTEEILNNIFSSFCVGK